jgi:WD40 repeat protein
MYRTKIVGLSLSADGRTLAVGCSGMEASIQNKVVLWDLPAMQATDMPLPHVDQVAWAPNRPLLAILTNVSDQGVLAAGRVHLWDRVRDETSFLPGPRGVMTCVAFSADGQMLAVGDRDRTVQVYDVPQRTERNSLGHEEEVYQVAFSPDGTRLAAGLRDGRVTVWDLAAGTALHSWQAHPAAVSGLLFTADGKGLLTAGTVEATVKEWDLGTWEEKRSFKLQMGWVTGLGVTPDGRSLAVTGGSFHRPGVVLLLDPATGQEQRRFEVHANTVVAAVFTPDGKTLIAATAPTVRPFTWRRHSELYRWDVATGEDLPLR